MGVCVMVVEILKVMYFVGGIVVGYLSEVLVFVLVVYVFATEVNV